jgi:hypothetical protein
MNEPETAEIAWAAIDACAIAKLLDRLTGHERGLSPRELCLVRAHAWALADGLRSMLAGLPKAWVGPQEHTSAPAAEGERAGGKRAPC